MVTGLVALLTPFVSIMPLRSIAGGTCTIDAYITCELYKNREKLEGLDYIPLVTTHKNKLWGEWVKKAVDEKTIYKTKNVLYRLQWKGFIKEVSSEGEGFPFILEMIGINDTGYILEKADNKFGHAICVIGETGGYYVGINNWGTGYGYSGYYLIDKSFTSKLFYK